MFCLVLYISIHAESLEQYRKAKSNIANMAILQKASEKLLIGKAELTSALGSQTYNLFVRQITTNLIQTLGVLQAVQTVKVAYL